MDTRLSSDTSLFQMLNLVLKRSITEARDRLCYYIISLCACFLAIFIALVADTVISQAPLIFLRMSELRQGEIDVGFYPNTLINEGEYDIGKRQLKTVMRYFNMTKIDKLTESEFGLLAPRLAFGNAYATKENIKKGFILLLLDRERENKLKIGTKYEAPVLKEGECSISQELAEDLEVQEGEEIIISLDGALLYILVQSIQQFCRKY